MKKKVLATLLTAAMFATTLVGCGGGDAGSAPAADDGATAEAPAADGGSDDAAADDGAAEEAPADDAAAAEEEIPTATFGSPRMSTSPCVYHWDHQR